MSSRLQDSNTQQTANRGGRPTMTALAVVALVLSLGACGDGSEVADEVSSVEPAAAADETASAEDTSADDEDHDDEDHDDEDHDDEDHEEDHDDEDHDDEDHDDHDDHDHEESNGLGAHEHGSASLSVAWIDSDVVIDLISPTENVFGFEYEAETDEDVATVAERTEALIADGIVVNDEAGCELSEPVSTETEREGSHSEITVSWSFTCANPDAVSAVELAGLFTEFPGFEDVDAEWISASSQSSAELTPEQTTLSLES